MLSRARKPSSDFWRISSPAGVSSLLTTWLVMMLFLCGPESRDITGAALPIDGGWSIS